MIYNLFFSLKVLHTAIVFNISKIYSAFLYLYLPGCFFKAQKATVDEKK